MRGEKKEKHNLGVTRIYRLQVSMELLGFEPKFHLWNVIP